MDSPIRELINIGSYDNHFPSPAVVERRLKDQITFLDSRLRQYETAWLQGKSVDLEATDYGYGSWSTLNSPWGTVSSSYPFGFSRALNLSQPVDFYTQLKEQRKLCGEPIGSRDNEINSTISMLMDIRKNAPAGYGYEILPKLDLNDLSDEEAGITDQILGGIRNLAGFQDNKDIKAWVDEIDTKRLQSAVKNASNVSLTQAMKLKEICDYWASNVNHPNFFTKRQYGNEDARPIQSGLDALRLKFHQALHEGIVFLDITIGEWDIPNVGKYILPMTIFFIDPIMMEPYNINRPKDDILEMLKGGAVPFNPSEIGWRYKSDLNSSYKGKAMTRSKYRRQYIVPIDMRDGQLMPIPFLIRRGAYAISQQIRVLQNSDHKVAHGVIRSILLIKVGSEALLKAFPNQVKLPELKARAEALLAKVSSASGVSQAHAVLPGEGVEYVEPNTASMLSSEKFKEPYRALLDALGIMTIEYDAHGRAVNVLSPKPIFLDMLRNTRIETKFWQQSVFQDIIIGMNQKEFAGMKTPLLKSNTMAIFQSTDEYAYRRFLFQTGHISSTEGLSDIGLNAEAEALLRVYERNAGYDTQFQPRITNAQVGNQMGSSNESDTQKNNRNNPYKSTPKTANANRLSDLFSSIVDEEIIRRNGNGKSH